MGRIGPALLASAWLAAGAAAAAVAEPTEARQQELRDMVIQDCGSCHGLTLRGGLGRPIRPENVSPYPDEAIAEIILDGIPGTPMPPWRGLVSEPDALWIAQQLKKGLVP